MCFRHAKRFLDFSQRIFCQEKGKKGLARSETPGVALEHNGIGSNFLIAR